MLSCSDSNKHYKVIVNAKWCSEKPASIPQCTSDRCHFLCRHMISCTCYDYSEGHLCKHCHNVWGSSNHMEPKMEVCTEDLTNVSYGHDPEVKLERRAGIYYCDCILYIYT